MPRTKNDYSQKKIPPTKNIPWTRHVGSCSIIPTRGSQIRLYPIMNLLWGWFWIRFTTLNPIMFPLHHHFHLQDTRWRPKWLFSTPVPNLHWEKNRSTKLAIVFGLHPLYIPVSPIVWFPVLYLYPFYPHYVTTWTFLGTCCHHTLSKSMCLYSRQ